MEIRITIEVLDADGNVLASNASEPLLMDHDDEGIQGSFDTVLDDLIAEVIEQTEDDDDEEPTAFEEGDYLLSDARSGGVSVSEHGGPFLGTFEDRTAAEAFIVARMAREQFFPNVWFISDHGNAHLVQVDR